MRHHDLTPQLVVLLADRFKALGEPARLGILSELRAGEATVTDLVERTGMGQANVSKHLQHLHAMGLVERRKDGLYVHYSLADEDVFRMCDIVCGRIDATVGARARVLAAR